ncbi:MAG: hypothetical protein K2I37_07530 [Muribaculaceae bacterium]|nr:hypothetical protein [Muribaculaceae bacterium]
MKKIMTTLFAMTAVLCASAANPGYTVSPADSTVVENRNDFTVTFTFDSPVKIQHVQFIGGERFNATRTVIDQPMTEAATEIKVNVPADVWGTPSAGNYLLEVSLPEIYNVDDEQYMVEETDPETGDKYRYAYTAQGFYISPTGEVVEFKGLDPDPATTTVWNVYGDGWGFCNFLFSGEVALTDTSYAEINYVLAGGRVIPEEVDYDALWADWDFWTGYFAVTVPMVENAALTQGDLTKIEITLYDIKVGATVVDKYVATYNLVSAPEARSKAKTASSKLTLTTEKPSTLYDINGNVVMNVFTPEKSKELPAGLYIMNGKKFIVR